MRRLASVLLWSAISAAFIGPGTVTTAGKAGAEKGFTLLWALVLSTLLCLVLQEAAASLAIRSGRSLPAALFERHGFGVAALVVGAVILGCAAFEAGNVLGAVAGASLAMPLPTRALVAATGVLAALVLAMPDPGRVARTMGVLVALMGLAFAAAAFAARPALVELARGALVPSIPSGSESLVLGLFGTTVVPYNLFLGSRLAAGQRLADVRLGLAVAVPLGGLISAAILVVGAQSPAPFDYGALAAALGRGLGAWAATFFALGLFIAGLSSAVTAPLAAGASLDDLLRAKGARNSAWRSVRVALGVLAIGLAFGLADLKPVPVIVLAQAANGLLLPFVAFFLLRASLDQRRKTGEHGGLLPLAALHVAVALSVLLGARASLSALFGAALPTSLMLGVAGLVALLLTALAHARPATRGR